MWLSSRNKRQQQGLAVLTYLLFSIFLFGLIGAMVIKSRWGSSDADKQWGAAMDMVAQANLIRSKLLDCAGNDGDNGTPNNKPFPRTLNTAGTLVVAKVVTEAPVTGVNNSGVVCPSNNTQLMSGADGVFLPPPPKGFNAWTYLNNTDCISIRLTASSAANSVTWAPALTQAVEKLGAAAASVEVVGGISALRVVILRGTPTATCALP